MRDVVAAEWIKIRTVRSTGWTMLLTVALGTGLGALVGLSFRNAPARPGFFDPLFAAFYSLTLAQLPLVVFGVVTVTAEYTSGTIHASLAAVPRRGVFYAGKLLGCLPLVLGVSVATVLGSFFASQATLGPDGVGLGAPGVSEAVIGCSLYLTLMCLFAAGLGMLLRSSTVSLAILLPLLFLGSQGLGNVPGLKTFLQYLPDQAGAVMLHLTGPPGDPQFGRDYGAWTGLAILTLWTAAALLAGHLTLRRRDA
ncbi:ABC transporter [Microtetraspora sp. NBRC 13810]|uniref:ABC transporter permease subunit n=1 Tax=Microtetraspora sp. NBRC 13810 TaxID=3030990 RepID=UPI0024A13BF9|nr:ABC transporter permease subunit [Microtetraspora sp. NBRC 13810]GLW08432.1 ABC transporter [Microtetraspora sp. NBRC 13810]